MLNQKAQSWIASSTKVAKKGRVPDLIGDSKMAKPSAAAICVVGPIWKDQAGINLEIASPSFPGFDDPLSPLHCFDCHCAYIDF